MMLLPNILVDKIFNNETIRTVWDKESEKYYISVVDIIGIVSESNNPQTYWRVLKKRLKDEGNETVTNCNALKLKAQDGKYRLTDVVDIEGMFRIIESVPSKNAEPIKQWLEKLGSGRIAKNTRNHLEEELHKSVISNQNNLNYQYLEEKEKLENIKINSNDI